MPAGKGNIQCSMQGLIPIRSMLTINPVRQSHTKGREVSAVCWAAAVSCRRLLLHLLLLLQWGPGGGLLGYGMNTGCRRERWGDQPTRCSDAAPDKGHPFTAVQPGGCWRPPAYDSSPGTAFSVEMRRCSHLAAPSPAGPSPAGPRPTTAQESSSTQAAAVHLALQHPFIASPGATQAPEGPRRPMHQQTGGGNG